MTDFLFCQWSDIQKARRCEPNDARPDTSKHLFCRLLYGSDFLGGGFWIILESTCQLGGQGNEGVFGEGGLPRTEGDNGEALVSQRLGPEFEKGGLSRPLGSINR